MSCFYLPTTNRDDPGRRATLAQIPPENRSVRHGQFLNALRIIENACGDVPASCGDSFKSPQEFIDSYFATIERSPNYLSLELSTQESFALVKHVDSNGSSPDITPFTSAKGTEIEFYLDREEQIFMDLGLPSLGKGSHKDADTVVHFRTWNRFAKLTLRDLRMLDKWKNEVAFCSSIEQLAKPEREGLIHTYSVSQDGLSLFQEWFPGDLLSFFDEYGVGMLHLLEILRQLSHGLSTLHNVLGIIHEDIKPENVLAKIDDSGRIKAVYMDFGFSERKDPNSTHQTSGLNGTLEYMAPEIYQERISGKVDVFAQGAMTHELLYGGSTPWENCGRPAVINSESGKETIANFVLCQQRELRDFLSSNKTRKRYTTIDHLIIRSIHPDPEKRITSEQFYNGIVYLLEKETRAARNPQYRVKNFNPSRGDLYKTGKAELDIKLGDYRNGSYAVCPTNGDGNSAFYLIWKDWDGEMQIKILDIPQSQTARAELDNEIAFLKRLGTLTTEAVTCR